ncbi:MAG TPA: hypothetical protein VHP34_00945 [Alphaproteobacteria bacterium]|jgi:hypothetical protein|nr:hypothetical protein [Alphaproteobacteria bacterium]
MSANSAEIITEYDVMFALRTGVTIMIPQTETLNCGIEVPVHFTISPDNPRDILISANGKSAVLKDLRQDYLDEAVERGIIMFYEMKDEEVIRCTPCSYSGK